MAFDPDAFLSGGTTATTGKFDPDAFLNSYTLPGTTKQLSGDADEYARRIASWQNQQPAQLSMQEMARTQQLTNEPGAVTGGTGENNPFTGKKASEKPLLTPELIKKALSSVGEIGATEAVRPDAAQDSINQAIADRLSGMTSERFVSTLPKYLIPGYAEAQGLEGVSHIPENFRNARTAGDYTGAGLDAAMSALMLGHRLIPAGTKEAEQWQQNQKSSTTPQTRGETTTPGQATEPSSPTSLPPSTQTPARPAAPSSTELGAKNLPPERGAGETPLAKSQSAEQAPSSQQSVQANGLTPEQQQAYDLHMQWYENERKIQEEKARPNPSANKIEQLENQQILDAFDEHKLTAATPEEIAAQNARAAGIIRESQGSTPPPKNESTGILERSTGGMENAPIPISAHHEALKELYGDAIERGQGERPQAMIDQGRVDVQSGKIDPYAVASKVTSGRVTSPQENGTLIAEHERLAREAIEAGRIAEASPTPENKQSYEELRQRSENFAVNVLKPAATKSGDSLRVWQAVSPPDLATETGMREAMRLNVDRELAASEISEAKRMAKENEKSGQMATAAETNLYRQLDKDAAVGTRRIPSREEIGRLFSDLGQVVCG